jgi:threonine dehydrogenase-like Zn-dependent dehydrogenase
MTALRVERPGNPALVDTALRLARRGGTVILEGIGDTRAGVDPNLITLGQLRVQGIFGAAHAAWVAATGLFAAGVLDPSPLITHRFSLERFTDAIATLRDPESGAIKVLIVPDSSPLAARVP